MAIDFREISLTDEQKRRIAELAERSGQPWNKVLEQELAVATDAFGGQHYRSYRDKYIHDREKRITYFREWVSRRKSYNPGFDDSRESIYPDRC
jgi:hypothetical protein